jgi:hypothetical protein
MCKRSYPLSPQGDMLEYLDVQNFFRFPAATSRRLIPSK